MVRNDINIYVIWIIRIILGLAVALLLAVVGDITARVFNLVLGYPWHPSVHQNIQVIGIGVGAGCVLSSLAQLQFWKRLDSRYFVSDIDRCNFWSLYW